MTCFTQVPQFVKTFGCKLILDRNLPNFLNKNILTGIYFYLIIYQTFLVKRKNSISYFYFLQTPFYIIFGTTKEDLIANSKIMKKSSTL
jgi:hypothetical protein